MKHFVLSNMTCLFYLVETILPQECNFTGNAPLTSGVVTAANLGAIARDLEPGKEEEQRRLCVVCVCVLVVLYTVLAESMYSFMIIHVFRMYSYILHFMMKYSELRNSVQIYNKYVAQRFADMADGTAAIAKWWENKRCKRRFDSSWE